MDNSCDMSFLIEQVRTLSGSYSVSPFAILELDIDDSLREVLELFTSVNLANYHRALGVMEWLDYNHDDLDNHLQFSKEFSRISPKVQPVFLNERMRQLSEPAAFVNWKMHQANLAIGIILASAKQKNCATFMIPDVFNEELEFRIHKLANQRLFQLIAFDSYIPEE